MTTAPGKKIRNTVPFGHRTTFPRIGRPTAPAIGVPSARGAGPGTTTRPGALRHFTTVVGTISAAIGAGARVRSTRELFMAQRSSVSSAAALDSELTLALVSATVTP